MTLGSRGDANFSINYPLYNSRVGKKLFIGIAVKYFSFVAFWIKNQLCMINVPTFPELSELGLYRNYIPCHLAQCKSLKQGEIVQHPIVYW